MWVWGWIWSWMCEVMIVEDARDDDEDGECEDLNEGVKVWDYE